MLVVDRLDEDVADLVDVREVDLADDPRDDHCAGTALDGDLGQAAHSSVSSARRPASSARRSRTRSTRCRPSSMNARARSSPRPRCSSGRGGRQLPVDPRR